MSVQSKVAAYMLAAVLISWLPGHAQQANNAGHYWYREQGITDSAYSTADIKQDLDIAKSLHTDFPDSARQVAYRALYRSRHIHYTEGMAIALNTLGMLYLNKGAYDSAIALLHQSAHYTATLGGNNQLYAAYVNLGSAYFYKGDYERALDYYYRALENTSNNNLKATANDSFRIYLNIALVWNRLGGNKQAMEVLQKIERNPRLYQDSNAKADFYSIAANTYAGDNPRLALDYYQKALAIAQAKKLNAPAVAALNTIARIYVSLKMPDSAMIYVKEAEAILDQYPDAFNYDRFHTRDNLGHIYMLRKEYKKAEQILTSVYEDARAIDLTDIVIHIEPDLAELYAATGRPGLAYEHMQHYALLKDTISEQQRSKSVDLLLQLRKNEQDKAMMAKNLRLSQQQRLLQFKNFWITGIAAGSALLLLILIVFVRNYRHRQRIQQADMLQLRQEQEINQLKAQVRGEEQERNRIALALHDGIASQLWAIKLNVDSLRHQSPESDQQVSLGAIYQQLDDTTKEVRSTAHNLMPDLLLEEGLGTAVASLCEKIKKQTSLEVDFLEYGIIPRMDEAIELSLYRMVQELVQNALKHAIGATSLLVQLSCTDALLNITVEDNGAGFADAQPEQGKEGIGLRHIEKRVKALQGHIDIQSRPGKGTTVYMEFDIKHLV